MNYRHAYHAGNFGDVAKHAVLALLIRRLQAKATAFRVIDTHAGAGLTRLSGPEAGKTGEWQAGIGRLLQAQRPPRLEALLGPYLEAVRAANPEGGIRVYPGSPWLVRHLLRQQDRLTAIELHPEDAAALAELFAGDIQVRVIHLDGWLAMGSFVPPKERRGLVLVDPPFEQRDEFGRMLEAFGKAHRRWPTGIYALWYPLKDSAAVRRFHTGLRDSGIPKLLKAEMTVRAPLEGTFSGCGMIIANPPWRFEEELATLLTGLSGILAQGAGARAEIALLAGEAPAGRPA